MTPIPTWYDVAATAVTGIGLTNCIIFCLWYWIRSRGTWRKTEHGKFLMLFVACLSSIFALVLANRIFGAWPYRLQISLGLYSVYCLITLWLPRLVWVSARGAVKKQEER